jgi:hypothetical protein
MGINILNLGIRGQKKITPSGTYSNTGGIITIDGLYTIHKFLLGDETFFIPCKSGHVEVLVVAGGGGGCTSGGGGGGLIHNLSYSVIAYSGVETIVGDGGDGQHEGIAGKNGEDSIFGILDTIGGGGGQAVNVLTGIDGGSGGGGAASSVGISYGGIGIAGQGHDGSGDAGYCGSPYPSGGGGGGGAAGAVPSTDIGSDGGIGLAFDILEAGIEVFYAGGGAGCCRNPGTPGIGGVGGGGGGGTYPSAPDGISGIPNTGGGGGGAAYSGLGGKGGSGIIIVRCLTSAFLI